MRSFVKIKASRNGKITLSFIDIGKPCLSHEFFTSLICLLMLFTKIKFSRKFPNLQYVPSTERLWTIMYSSSQAFELCPSPIHPYVAKGSFFFVRIFPEFEIMNASMYF